MRRWGATAERKITPTRTSDFGATFHHGGLRRPAPRHEGATCSTHSRRAAQGSTEGQGGPRGKHYRQLTGFGFGFIQSWHSSMAFGHRVRDKTGTPGASFSITLGMLFQGFYMLFLPFFLYNLVSQGWGCRHRRSVVQDLPVYWGWRGGCLDKCKRHQRRVKR